MKILDRLPISQVDSSALVGTEGVRLKKHEIIVWVSLTKEDASPWIAKARRFPAIIDTGHTHNFAIQTEHLVRWAGIGPEALLPLGHIRHDGRRMPLHALKMWLHRNQPHQSALDPSEPFLFELPSGIAVYPAGANYPRLPLLGLRAILSNHLHLTVDGEHATVTLRTPDWRTRLAGWLG